MNINIPRIVIASPQFSAYFATENFGQVHVEEDVVNADLVIFSGGEDIDPSLYGESINGAYGISRDRDAHECQVFDWAMKHNKPILGVCRGHQLINALLGGKLVQDIFPGHGGIHHVEYVTESGIREVFPHFINSYHHQGYTVDMCASALTPVAIHRGIVEISRGRKILTTQFHPEFTELYTEFLSVVLDELEVDNETA